MVKRNRIIPNSKMRNIRKEREKLITAEHLALVELEDSIKRIKELRKKGNFEEIKEMIQRFREHGASEIMIKNILIKSGFPEK